MSLIIVPLTVTLLLSAGNVWLLTGIESSFLSVSVNPDSFPSFIDLLAVPEIVTDFPMYFSFFRSDMFAVAHAVRRIVTRITIVNIVFFMFSPFLLYLIVIIYNGFGY